MNNIQSFSRGSEQYAKYRPQYPDELFVYLSELSQYHDRVWDCGTGNGQAAISCAKYFAHVEATDISSEQIQNCIAHPKIRYSVSPAEHTSFDKKSFDLITVALAIHWFDQEKFFKEAERVLKPNGVLAVWGYGRLEFGGEIDQIITTHLHDQIERFWGSGNLQVRNRYRDLILPFDEVDISQTFSIKVEWNLEQLLEYYRTWSAVKRYSAELGSDPVSELEIRLRPVWNEPDKTKLGQMPLFLKASKKPIVG